MANRRTTTDTAASDAATVDTAAVAGTASVETEGKAITTVDISPAAQAQIAAATVDPRIAAAQKEVASIETALGMLPADSVAAQALTAALETARGTLALAQADVDLETAHSAEIAAARDAAAAHKLPDYALAAMLQAIEVKYAPAPAPEVEVVVPEVVAGGKKPVSARTAAINAAAASADTTRAAQALATFDKLFAADLSGVARTSGTRFASLVALAGGVTGSADYQSLTAQVRNYMRYTLGVAGSGDSYATNNWVFALKEHGAGGGKQGDSLPLKFLSRAAVALHSDGMFRLTLPNTAGARFPIADAAAMALWHGNGALARLFGAGAQAEVAAAPATPTVPAAPIVPTPPAAAATASGAVVPMALCQHCQTRNRVGDAACRICEADDWNGGA